MDAYLVWIIAGFILIIAELLTGTFYLLMLGIAAIGTAAIAAADAGFPLQAFTATVLAIASCWLVHNYRIRNSQQQMQPVDFGQPVMFENWLDESNRIARVRYRNAPWEATVEPGVQVVEGSTLYISSCHGSTLMVVKMRPEWKIQ